MTSKIVQISRHLDKGIKGGEFTRSEVLEAVYLLAESKENLIDIEMNGLPPHDRHNCETILEMLPEKRCSIFLDGMSYGAIDTGDEGPEKHAYEIIRQCLPAIGKRLSKPWYTALEEHEQEIRTLQQQ